MTPFQKMTKISLAMETNELLHVFSFILGSVEVIRYTHSMWINWDGKMKYRINQDKEEWARARTTTLNEELGQVKHHMSRMISLVRVIYFEIIRVSFHPLSSFFYVIGRRQCFFS